MSVPSQNSRDGGLKRLIGITACGSIVPSQGAKIAMATITTRMAPPISAVGWRRNASRKRRHVGDTDLAGAIADAVSVATPISITDAWIEEHVRQIDQEIDQDIDRRKNEDYPLNDRVIAAQDRVHRQAPD